MDDRLIAQLNGGFRFVIITSDDKDVRLLLLCRRCVGHTDQYADGKLRPKLTRIGVLTEAGWTRDSV